VPVKRRLSKQHDGRISPQVVALYQRALALREQAERGEIDWLEAHEAAKVVTRALGVRMWQTSPFDVVEFYKPGDPDWSTRRSCGDDSTRRSPRSRRGGRQLPSRRRPDRAALCRSE
jgi:hypothetical protein